MSAPFKLIRLFKLSAPLTSHFHVLISNCETKEHFWQHTYGGVHTSNVKVSGEHSTTRRKRKKQHSMLLMTQKVEQHRVRVVPRTAAATHVVNITDFLSLTFVPEQAFFLVVLLSVLVDPRVRRSPDAGPLFRTLQQRLVRIAAGRLWGRHFFNRHANIKRHRRARTDDASPSTHAHVVAIS